MNCWVNLWVRVCSGRGWVSLGFGERKSPCGVCRSFGTVWFFNKLQKQKNKLKKILPRCHIAYIGPARARSRPYRCGGAHGGRRRRRGGTGRRAARRTARRRGTGGTTTGVGGGARGAGRGAQGERRRATSSRTSRVVSAALRIYRIRKLGGCRAS